MSGTPDPTRSTADGVPAPSSPAAPAAAAPAPASAEGREGTVRVTKQRRAVTGALEQLDDFVSAQDLHRWLHDRDHRVSLATVYRILQSLADDGAVDVLRSGEGEAIYRRCEVAGHHHHLVCRQCGRAVEIEAPTVEAWTARIAAEHGFTDPGHTVEIFGLCPDCSRG
ncbi:Fur family transcriptional regulator [Zhihengliuella sp.]|uniref:Fur family transcriptional regulator n=1 Tax=Zhihengliuella sp. TaxID=1954483 RepID=UPI002811D3E0|nr:Fur family transcriptional regulator [Zhihengliuella sp.]